MPPEMRLAFLVTSHTDRTNSSLYLTVHVQVWWEDVFIKAFDMAGGTYLPFGETVNLTTLETFTTAAARMVSRAMDDHLEKEILRGGVHNIRDIIAEFELVPSSAEA